MAGITFTEGSGLQDSIFGKSQAPIRMFLEKRGESFEQMSVLKEVFNMETSNKFGEKMTTMTAMDGFQPVGENGTYPMDSMQEGFGKFLEHMTWKDSFAMSQEIVEDAKLMDLKKRPAQFIAGYYRTREKFGAALYGSAISGGTSFTFAGKRFDSSAADGKALFATDHPSVLAKNKNTQSNKFSDAFSNDALGAMETAMQGFRGDNDEILDVAPDTIMIPNDYNLKKTVFAAIGADKDPTTSNNGFNYQYGRWTVIIWPYLNQFIAALGIPEVGRHAGRILNRKFGGSWDAFERAILDQFDFTQLEDFGQVMNDNIYCWYSDEEEAKLWRPALNHITFLKEETTMPEAQNNPFAGKTVVATGKLENYTRDGIQMKLLSLGARPASSVSKKTDYLIVGENAGSKLTKAQTLGVTTLTEQQFLQMLADAGIEA